MLLINHIPLASHSLSGSPCSHLPWFILEASFHQQVLHVFIKRLIGKEKSNRFSLRLSSKNVLSVCSGEDKGKWNTWSSKFLCIKLNNYNSINYTLYVCTEQRRKTKLLLFWINSLGHFWMMCQALLSNIIETANEGKLQVNGAHPEEFSSH